MVFRSLQLKNESFLTFRQNAARNVGMPLVILILLKTNDSYVRHASAGSWSVRSLTNCMKFESIIL